jgi:recombination protein RecR
MSDLFPDSVKKLISCLKKLPGVGSRTAERFAFHFLQWEEEDLSLFSKTLEGLKESLLFCNQCHFLMHEDSCKFCNNPLRDFSSLCIVCGIKDAYAIEKMQTYRGQYHVLGGLLSPLKGHGPDSLNIDSLLLRLQNQPFEEVIIALDSTLEGEATSLYLKQQMMKYPVSISRLAYGIPIGSPLEFVDGTTLSRAFTGRLRVS